MDKMLNPIEIEVAYALYEKQYLYVMTVEAGTTAGEALKASPLLVEIPDLNIDQIGIFASLVKPDYVLRAGDRIEVYRPLKIDPKERRRNKVTEDRNK